MCLPGRIVRLGQASWRSLDVMRQNWRQKSEVGIRRKQLMNPDQVRAVIEHDFPQVSFKPRRNPDGWAFYVGSTRIARAVQSSAQAPTYFKLALSSRQGTERILVAEGAEQVRSLFANELLLL